MPSTADKRATFRKLHQSGCFAIPNPWDIGSARYLQHLGFKALATTSAGFAWSRGLPDNGITRDMALQHLAELAAATDLPLNADYENGFAHDPAGVAESSRLAVETGVAGFSIEDASGDKDKPLYDIDHAVERIKAARQAIDKTGGDTLLVGRAECFLVGRTDINEVTQRLRAYADAGADCLYAPGLRSEEHITAVVRAVAPKPVNLLVGGPLGFTMAQIEAMGVRRVSVGGAFARAAWGGLARVAKALAGEGTFDVLKDAMPHPELNGFMRTDAKQRTG
jgi:2-methylisocitrate lyase-like PEP mutase family enzyme